MSIKPTPQMTFKTDLACGITASEDEAGAKPIPYGGHFLRTGGGVTTVWVHSTVLNAGPTAAKFSVKRSVKRYGSTYDVQAELVLLAPGEIKKYKTPIIVNYLGTGTIEAEIMADADNVISETNELNNWAHTAFKATLIG